MAREGWGIIERNPDIQHKVDRLHKRGLGSRAIATKLEEEDDISIGHMTVYRYLKKVQDRKEEILNKDQELTKYVKESIFDTSQHLKKVNKMLWDLIEEPGVTRKFKLKTIKQITDTIKLADSLLNEFKGIKVDARGANKVNIVHTVIAQLNKMEERGDIKILNPKLRRGEGKETIIDVEE